MNQFILSSATVIDCGRCAAPVRNAADILRGDIERCLTGTGPAGAIRLSVRPDLAEEAWRMAVTESEIRIEHADDLGAIYALLTISARFLGIGPMDWWNDRAPEPRESVPIPCQALYSPAFAVRYRGWFINDEVLLDGWAAKGEARKALWRRIFETLLRCGGNMVIPGTDRAGEGLDMLASDMGLILTHHHAELLGAEMFGRVWPQLPGSYRLYPDKFEALWRRAAERYRDRKVIYAIGFRAQSDIPFWLEDDSFDTPEKRGAEISRIMRRQMEIVRAVSPDALFCTNLYGEMMPLYRQGLLDIPPEVIKVWGDNGYGRMVSRRQGLDNPRSDAMPRGEEGANGIYFHAGFYDLQAANHLTQLQIAPAALAKELSEVLSNGANSYWIINTGSIKPHIYILDLIRAIWTDGPVDADAHARAYARDYFADEAVSALLTGYADCAADYGANPDDKAGDQYYAHAVREIVCRIMRGQWTESEALSWAERGDLTCQLDGLCERVAPTVPRWRGFIARCAAQARKLPEAPARLLRATLKMNAAVHLSGCEALLALQDAVHALKDGKAAKAFFHAGQALESAETGCAALHSAEYGKWTGYYANDCFTNLRLMADCLRAFRSWIRMTGDGPYFWNWERACLMAPEDTRVLLQTTRHCQLTDDALYAGMKQKGCF